MPRNRSSDETRQPILRDNNDDGREYQDNELEEITCCNPAKTWFRFVALIFMCLVGFGKPIVRLLITQVIEFRCTNPLICLFSNSLSLRTKKNSKEFEMITQRKITFRSHMFVPFRLMTRISIYLQLRTFATTIPGHCKTISKLI